MKLYFISGLGADRRAFYKIQLPASYEPVYLDWIKPLANESLADYARRFSAAIRSDEDFIIVGLSFGGILASELAKIVSPRKVIIISSLGSSKEQPWYFRLAAKFGLHRLISPAVYKQATLIHRVMGAGSKETKAIVYDYVRKADPEFIRWSLNAIVNWQHEERVNNLIHIHGSRDQLLPIRYVKADYIIRNGEHLMVMNRADEVNKILSEVLEPA